MRRLVALGLVLGACVSTPAPSRTPSAAPTTASPTPTAVAASPTPSPSATPTPQNVKLGLVIAEAGPPSVIRLRAESDTTPFATLNGFGPVVSPDGARLAYWGRASGSAQDVLRVLDLFSGMESDVTALSGVRAGGIAWRDDGGGLLFAGIAPGTAGPGGVDPPPAFTTVSTYVFATRQITEIKKLEASRFAPLGWSLASRAVAGVDSGEGGVRRIYRFKEDGSSAGDTPPDERLREVVDVTKDAKTILAQFSFFTGNRSFSGVRTVSATDPRPLAQHEAADGILLRARFRPASGDVAALIRVGDPSRFALEIWSGADLAATKRVWNGPAAPVGSGDLLMRIDGKAAYVRMDQTGGAGSIWQVVDLVSGSGTTLAMPSPPAFGPWSSFYVSDEGIAKLKKP